MIMMSFEMAEYASKHGVKAEYLGLTIPSAEILFDRMMLRGGEGEEVIRERVAASMVQDKQIRNAKWLDTYIINDDGDTAKKELRDWLKKK